MNTAEHSSSNKIYSANQFEKMGSAERIKLRKFLRCEKCKEKAFFRKKSRNGRMACFFAKHLAGCDLGHVNKSDGELSDKKKANKKESDSDTFGVKWTDLFKIISDETTSDLIDPFEIKGPAHTEYIVDPPKETISKLSLAKILHYARNGIVSKQDIRIVLNGKIDRLQNVVYHAHYLNKRHSGREGLFWGYLNSSDNESWLNISSHPPYKKFSVQLHPTFRNIFWARMGKIATWKQGVPFIVFGKLLLSQSEKPYVVVQEPTNIYIDKRAYNQNKSRAKR